MDWKAIWEAIKAFFAPPVYVPSYSSTARPPFDWDRWERDRYTDCPVFWLDPYRYAGTPLDWNEPSWATFGRLIAQSRANQHDPRLSYAMERARNDTAFRHWLVRTSDPLAAALEYGIAEDYRQRLGSGMPS